jgi:hypothetical protein
VVALRTIEKAQSPIKHIHPVAIRENNPKDVKLEEFGLCAEANKPADQSELGETGGRS